LEGSAAGSRWGGGAALAVASVPGSDGVVSACVNVTTLKGATTATPVLGGPNIQIIDTPSQQCTAGSQTSLTWGATGPTGPQGPAGTPGAAGATGFAGLPGAIGPTDTVADGGTLTLPNREVITGGATDTFTLTNAVVAADERSTSGTHELETFTLYFEKLTVAQ